MLVSACLIQGAAWGASDLSQPLRGVALGRPPPNAASDDAYLQALERVQPQVVRVMLDLVRCGNCDTYERVPAQTALLSRLVESARLSGMRIVLVLTPQPGGRAAAYWREPRLQQSIAAHWEALARQYKAESAALDFDLLNEPVEPADAPGAWRRLALDLVDRIRAVDPLRSIVFEPSPGALPRGFEQLEPLPRTGIVYSAHIYEPHAYTHQGLESHVAGVDYPGRVGMSLRSWDVDRLRAELEPVRRFQQRHSAAVYIGEFSVVRTAAAGGRARYLRDVVRQFNEYGWSWTYHAFRESPLWDLDYDLAAQPGPAKAVPPARRLEVSPDRDWIHGCIRHEEACR